MTTTVTLSLISHTNVGKTTLARTLLRRDVGEVRDQAHVTDVSEAFTLIETPSAVLRLWDTPGFGDTARLVKLLRRQRDPLGWLLLQVWDRVVDRPLFCSQLAVRNIRNHADVVLYLVNAAEDPLDAGYVKLELDLLAEMRRPVLLLLNQVGPRSEDVLRRWRELAADRPIVRDVLALDAFTRCWVEEDVLLRRVIPLLDGERQRAMIELAQAWAERNRSAYRRCIAAMARQLARTAADRERPRGSGEPDAAGALDSLKQALRFGAVDKRRAMTQLNTRLDRATTELMDTLIAAHGLEGGSAAKIEQRVQDFQVRGDGIPWNERSGALAGAVVSGALSGLAADALSGGLSLGGGMIAGGILGALGGAALGRGYRIIGGDRQPSVSWSPEFLDQLCHQVVLRYLAVAHFGRGRGSFRDLEQPAHWNESVRRALAPYADALRKLWTRRAEKRSDDDEQELRRVLDAAVLEVLRDAYPHADL